VTERTIATPTHGRYLIEGSDTARILVGFHGYAENAEIQMPRLCAIPGSDAWLKLSIQGLHRFYQRKTNTVVASWMTSQDRDLAIADNTAYVQACLNEVASAESAIVFAGFSQGVAMAFRAAASSKHRVLGVIAVGGDVPPELTSAELGRMQRALLVRGQDDAWYTHAMFKSDGARLQAAGVDVTAFEFAGGHEWSTEVCNAASLAAFQM